MKATCISSEGGHEIAAHAREALPEEACGVVIRRPDGSRQVLRGRNVSPTPTVAYELDAATLLRALAAGEIVAFYHSHPHGPPALSPADRRAMQAGGAPTWPGVAWIVATPSGVAAFSPEPPLDRPDPLRHTAAPR